MVLSQVLSFILWDVKPEILPDTFLPLRWYGLLFAAAFLFGQYIITHIFQAEGKSQKDVDALTYYMIGATVLGARLGHCLFYQPDYYLANPLEILKIWEGGLASHGATAGILIAMWWYSKSRPDQSWLWILDRIVIVVALGGAFIRMGNLMNSEIIGKPADLPWSMVFVQPFETTLMKYEGSRIESIDFSRTPGNDTVMEGKTYHPLEINFVFQRDRLEGSSEEAFLKSALPSLIESSNGTEEQLRYFPEQARPVSGFDEKGRKTLRLTVFGLPRHPAMVYESISTFLLFVVLFGFWKQNVGKVPEGRLFSVFVIVLFSLRFLYEFLKENQVEFESELPLNMGQNLSIPLVIAGFYFLYRSFRKNQTTPS